MSNVADIWTFEQGRLEKRRLRAAKKRFHRNERKKDRKEMKLSEIGNWFVQHDPKQAPKIRDDDATVIRQNEDEKLGANEKKAESKKKMAQPFELISNDRSNQSERETRKKGHFYC